MGPTFIIVASIASVLSLLASLIFILFYFLMKNLRFGLGMKYFLLMQISNLAQSLSFIVIQALHNNGIFECFAFIASCNLTVHFQTCMIGFYFFYLYKVICLGRNKNEMKIFNQSIIALTYGILESIFEYLAIEDHSINCTTNEKFDLISLFLDIFISALTLIWCCYSGYKIMKKKKSLLKSTRKLVFLLLRILSFPFITFMCVIPAIVYQFGTFNKIIDLIIIFNLQSIGFYNFIAMLFIEEFRVVKKRLIDDNPEPELI